MSDLGEQVVLCAPDGAAIGTAPKAAVHTRDTPLHLAFSCYVFDRAGRLLVTRRAFSKATFPGVRTNSCCGHPAPGEGMVPAIGRRLRQELGLEATKVTLVLPTFRYRAVASDGTVENELCPVYRAIVDSPSLAPDPAEVDDAWWLPWGEFATEADAGLSPWAAEQIPQLRRLGPDPLAWAAGDPSLLPRAAIP